MNTDFRLSDRPCIACGSRQFARFYTATKSAPISNREILVFDQRLECCNKCGLIRQEANDSYTDVNLEKYYSMTFRTPAEPTALARDDHRVVNAKKRLKFIGQLKKKGSLLEVGFGDGIFLRLAAKKYKCTGLDPSAGYQYIHDDLEQKGIDVSAKPLERYRTNKRFDVVCSFLVLEHIQDPLAFVSRQVKHLKRDGILVIEVPDIRRYQAFRSESVLTFEHVYHYCIESLSFLLAHLDLEPVSYSNTDVSYGFSMIAAFRLKKRKKAKPQIDGFGVLSMIQGFIGERERYRQQMTEQLNGIMTRAREKGELIAVYGTGFLFNYAMDCCALDLGKVELLLDDTKEKAGKTLFERTIQPLTALKAARPGVIIVFSEMFFELMKQNILRTVDHEHIEIIDIHQRSIQNNDHQTATI